MTDLQIFKNAPLNASAEELESYLDGACGGDATLRTRVEALFQAGAMAGGFMERPAMEGTSTESTRPMILDAVGTQILAVDEALTKLTKEVPDLARIVNLRYFAGMTVPETAAALGVSPSTIDRQWACARAWLFREITEGNR